jgi:hypothetical protein
MSSTTAESPLRLRPTYNALISGCGSKMFSVLGGRLTGSLTVSFISGLRQTDAPHGDDAVEYSSLPVQAHAVVYGHEGKSIWVPA